MSEPVRAAALRATVGALRGALGGGGHPRWGTFLRDTWGWPHVLERGRPVIWIVCAAGGEVVQAASLAPALRHAFPDATLLLSTTNHAFLEVAERIHGLDRRVYTPWDLRGPCRRAVEAVRPDVMITVESAWNPVLLRQARRRGARTLLASGTMLADYERTQPYRRPMRLRVLDALDVVGVKDAAEMEAFARLGVSAARLRVLGDLRLDATFHATTAGERGTLRARLGLVPDDCVMVAGSVHAGEEGVVLDAARTLVEKLDGFRLVIAPRYLARVPAIERACADRGLRSARVTTGSAARTTAAVVILDTYGDLAKVYALARFVVLGGTLVRVGAGLGQNLVEPLVHGVPVFFGPHARRWATLTSALRDVFPRLAIEAADDLVAGVLELEASPAVAAALRARATELLGHGAESAARHVAAVEALLAAPAGRRRGAGGE